MKDKKPEWVVSLLELAEAYRAIAEEGRKLKEVLDE